MDRWSILYLNVNKEVKKGKKKQKTSYNRKLTNCIYSKTKVELEHKFWLCLCQLRKTSQMETSSI